MMAKNDKTPDTQPAPPDVRGIDVDGKTYTPMQFKAEVLPKHPGRWPNCGAAKCQTCGCEYVSFGNGCPACGSMSVREM